MSASTTSSRLPSASSPATNARESLPRGEDNLDPEEYRPGHDGRVGDVEGRPAVEADEVDHGAAETDAVDEVAERAAEDDAQRGPVSRRREHESDGHAHGDRGHQYHDDRAGAGEPAERDPGVVVEVDVQAEDPLEGQVVRLGPHEPLGQLVGRHDGGRQDQGKGVPPLTSCHAAS